MYKCGKFYNKKCPYDWSAPTTAEIAKDNCPVESYEREDKYNPTNEKGERWISDSCYWLK